MSPRAARYSRPRRSSNACWRWSAIGAASSNRPAATAPSSPACRRTTPRWWPSSSIRPIVPTGALNADFFTYPEAEKFDTIIGNPPYVKARDIAPATRRHFASRLLDGHANLYLHFIEKCVRHLNPGGELIFITPRDFLKATGAARLNTWLFDQGTITDFEELGDARVFAGVVPNCAIWRFEKGNTGRRTHDGRRSRLCRRARSCLPAASTACR